MFPPSGQFYAQCADPRSGIDPYTQEPYPDEQGSYVDENNWLRSWSNELYLWYDEIEDRNPANYRNTLDYFHLLKTTERTAYGTPKDQFHWTAPTDEYYSVNQEGVAAGYGVTWATISAVPPREIVALYTEPGSPAKAADLPRGARVLAVDGVDIDSNTEAGVWTINAGLWPYDVGETHRFTIQEPGATETRVVTLESAEVTIAPVHAVSTIETATGYVGYLLFNGHIAPAEAALIAAIEELKAESVTDLVLDLRYNGGGYVDIASQLAYMIAGSIRTEGRVFDAMTFNDKYPNHDPVTGAPLEPIGFHSTTQGFSVDPGQPLPTLNLDRVFVLTSGNTCSASESIINGLRGVDVEVIQIGGRTCGKPYGAYVFSNCGTSYFSIQFKGENAKGYGDFTEGFHPGSANSLNPAELPGCSVPDDYNHPLGDPAEARLAAALEYRETGSCGTAGRRSGLQKVQPHSTDGVIRQPPGLNDKILRR